jgi:hypothetical protein
MVLKDAIAGIKFAICGGFGLRPHPHRWPLPLLRSGILNTLLNRGWTLPLPDDIMCPEPPMKRRKAPDLSRRERRRIHIRNMLFAALAVLVIFSFVISLLTTL